MTHHTEGARSTSLDKNPFRLLGVSTRDDRQKILDAAEERSLHLDPVACQQARADLTNPRIRLSVEMSWLPGVSPRTAETLVADLAEDPYAAALQRGLPELARANLMAAALEIANYEEIAASTTADFMRIFGEAVEHLKPEAILRDVNEDRAIAKFPEVRDATIVEDELGSRRKRFKEILKAALDSMPSSKLVETMTLLVERATGSGSKVAPAIIDDLVDSYAVETQSFLDHEEKNLSLLIDSARSAAIHGGAAVSPVLDKIEQLARNWSRVAQPIQLSMMARGMTHHRSQALGISLRSLGIDLYNEHSLLAHAERLTTLLRELFAEVGDVAERLAADAKTLQELSRSKSFDALLAPLRTSCKEAMESADSAPSSADQKATELANDMPGRLAKIGKSGVPADLVAGMSNEVAQAIIYCTIAFGNETNNWSRCIQIFASAKPLATDESTEERIATNLVVVRRNAAMFANLIPIKSAPSLYTLNGFGVTLYGKTDEDAETHAYTATYYFVALFIPLFPICRYRVIATGSNSYRFLGKGPLRTFDKAHLALSIALIAFMFLK
jgi:hypothetical protein